MGRFLELPYATTINAVMITAMVSVKTGVIKRIKVFATNTMDG